MSKLYLGKKAIITGATQGLGAAIARKLVAEGAAGLVISGRNSERGNALAAELSEAGTPTTFLSARLEEPQDCVSLVQQAHQALGFIDGLVNSGAVTTRGTLEDTSLELWDHHMAVNVRAPFLIMQQTVKHMQERGKGGSIVNIITQSAHGGQPFLTAYSTSKGALATLTKNAAYTQRWHKIRVNGVMVGWMDTEGEDVIQRQFHGAQDGWLEEAEAKQPMGKLVKSDEVADLVALMLSDRGGVMCGSLIDYDQNVIGPNS
ncbi:MAG: SDR family oxidoreductase [bacterium]|jgi:NAD(P)-dependent dehydrogenase (short-subunit alcohol dehydrogenase family)